MTCLPQSFLVLCLKSPLQSFNILRLLVCAELQELDARTGFLALTVLRFLHLSKAVVLDEHEAQDLVRGHLCQLCISIAPNMKRHCPFRVRGVPFFLLYLASMKASKRRD
jgi:hypothetical protein